MRLFQNFRYCIFIVALMIFFFSKAEAQIINDEIYQHKMQLMDSLSLYKMQAYDTLYEVSTLDTAHRQNYRTDYRGWVDNRSGGHISLINIHGELYNIDERRVVNVMPLAITDTTIAYFTKPKTFPSFDLGDFGGNYLLSYWLYKKGKFNYSKELLPNDTLHTDGNLIDTFGAIYYDAMLSAFSNERNYQKAVAIGNHLSESVFNGYEYQKQAIALVQQLKNNTEDFKTFRLPDSLNWLALKQKHTRKEQVTYLADRLRLLNCIQPGQPGGISYDMYQFSISYYKSKKLNISYWDQNSKYEVINPYIELIKMKLTIQETELLLPYLLSGDYIASYSYFRDFRPQRTLHKVSWVVNQLLYEITNKVFFNQHDFDLLPLHQKEIEVEKIKKWCDGNAALSPEELTVKILKTTDKWVEFQKAMQTAGENKYDAILPVIVARFNDFHRGFWPTNKGIMAETMYKLGNEKYVPAVEVWNKDTTDIWVNLWSSMFLLKYDKLSYEPAMKELEKILQQDDGTTYYPHAMELLLSMNDPRAVKLAEGILDKPQFPTFIYWDYYLNFIKELLVLKSDYTFNYISKKLDSFSPDEIETLSQPGGGMHMMMQSDNYVMAVAKLNRVKMPDDYFTGNITTRLAYKKELSKWFIIQYGLLKEGRPNELNLKLVPTRAPETFVDAPRDN